MANYNKKTLSAYTQKRIGPRAQYDVFKAKGESNNVKYAENKCRKLEFHYKEKKRPCLRCEKAFESQWAGNRICEKCTLNQDD